MKKIVFCLMIFLIFIGLFNNCKKKYTTTASGIVINGFNRQPIDSAIVVIQDGVESSSTDWINIGGNTSSDKKASTYTNENGYFSVTLTNHEYNAFMYVIKEDYGGGFKIEGIHWDGIQPLKSGAKNEDLVLVGYPYPRYTKYIIFKAIEITDTLNICQLSYENRNECSKKIWGRWEQTYRDHFYVYRNRYLVFKLSYYRNNNWHTKMDSIFINKNYELTYPSIDDTIYY